MVMIHKIRAVPKRDGVTEIYRGGSDDHWVGESGSTSWWGNPGDESFMVRRWYRDEEMRSGLSRPREELAQRLKG